MRKLLLVILTVCFILSIFSINALAQEKDIQKKDLIQLTIEQRWKRSNYLIDVVMIACVKYAKSMGEINAITPW